MVYNFFLVEELGEFGAEIKLSLFQLGLSPQIIASIIMQVSVSLYTVGYLCIKIVIDGIK